MMTRILCGVRRGIGFSSLLILCLLILPSAVYSAPKTVNIGVVCPLSGGGAVYGRDFLRSIEMAADEINARGGITAGGEKYSLKVISYDNEMKPAVAVKMAMRLKSLDHCSVIFVAESTSALSIMKYNEKEKFILMAVTTTPEFTEMGNKLIGRIAVSFSSYCKVMADESWKQGIRKVGMLVYSFETSKRWGGYFEKKWKEKGGQIVGIEETPVGNRDYYSRLTKLISASPDAILAPSISDESAALVVSQARELGFKGRFIFSEALDGDRLIEMVGAKATEGTLIAVGGGSLQRPERLAFTKRYKEKYPDGVIQPAGAPAYEGLYMVAKSMEKANTVTDVFKIRGVMPSIVPLPAEYRAAGFTKFEEDGDMGSNAFVAEVKNGKKVKVSK